MNESFPSVFEVYAHEYDLITNAAPRAPHHAAEVAAMIARFAPASVLDAGCATGLTTLLFARQGVAAVGLDRSPRILAVARQTRCPEGLPISYRRGTFEDLPKSLRNRFDLVVCLANAIAGVGTVARLNLALRNFSAALRPGGHLVLQMLNFAVVKENTLLPVKATHNDGLVYERFSERRGKTLAIYVTRADFSRTPPTFEVFRHSFGSFTPEQVTGSIARAGFTDLARFGDLLFTRRFSRRSRDLVIAARRPA